MRVLDLPVGARAEVLDPRRREHTWDVHDAVALERLEVLLRHHVGRLWRLPLSHPRGQRDPWVLPSAPPASAPNPATAPCERGIVSMYPLQRRRGSRQPARDAVGQHPLAASADTATVLEKG